MGYNLTKRLGVFFVFFIGLFLAQKAQAINPTYEPVATSSEVVVVYNSSYTTDSDSNGVQDSLQIANYYKAARGVPDTNIIGLAATTTEKITRSVYNSEIKAPLEAALLSAGVASSTKYIVLIKGIPLRIADSNPATGDFGTMSSDYSSVDAAVCLLFQAYTNTGVISNPYYADIGNDKVYRFKNGFYSNASVVLNYLVTRLDGYTLSNVLALVDRSLAADPTNNNVAFLLDGNSGGAISGYDQMSTAATRLTALGRNIVPSPFTSSTFVIGTSTLPVIAYSSYGTHSGPTGGASSMPQTYYTTTLSAITWAPGAVSSTYESYNGVSFSNSSYNNGQGQLAEFISVGGSGGIGNTFEPYASAIADEHIWTQLYAAGYNWADSAYHSLPYVDWVTVVIGDPLMTIGSNPVISSAVNLHNSSPVTTQTNLSWTLDPAITTYKLVSKSGSLPSNPLDGTIIYSGTSNNYTVSGLFHNQLYYFSIYCFDSAKNYANCGNISALRPANTVSFLSSTGSMSESGPVTSVTISFGATQVASGQLQLLFSGTAISDADYTVSTTSIAVPIGTSSLSFTLTPINNQIYEGNKSVIIGLGYDGIILTAGAYATRTVTLIDDDSVGIVKNVSSGQLAEGVATSTTYHLNSQPSADVNYNFTVTNSDYFSISTSTLYFNNINWSTDQTVYATATSNSLVSGTSTCYLVVTASSTDPYYHGLVATTTFTVLDDDVAGLVQVENNVRVTEGQTSNINFHLLAQPVNDVAITFYNSGSLGYSPTNLTFTNSNWQNNQAIAISAPNNSIVDGNRNTSLFWSANSVGTIYDIATTTITVVIVDDDVTVQSGSSGGGGGGSSGGGSSSGSLVSVTTITTTPAPIVVATNQTTASINNNVIVNPGNIDSLLASTGVTRNEKKEVEIKKKVMSDINELASKSFDLYPTQKQTEAITNFITYGISNETIGLGEGERRAVVRDYLDTQKTTEVNWQDIQRITTGEKPLQRNLQSEQQSAKSALVTFKKITGHNPDFKNKADDLAWNTLMYRIRFPRDTQKETKAITQFKKLIKSNPKSPQDWAVVRAIAYTGVKIK